ncbi:hypothetical protein BVI2075_960060 [Burkholderia vietnamiensis]|nr:hypothetical protein BVI2075_960060 [Burkholderia vietnamiensis]
MHAAAGAVDANELFGLGGFGRSRQHITDLRRPRIASERAVVVEAILLTVDQALRAPYPGAFSTVAAGIEMLKHL